MHGRVHAGSAARSWRRPKVSVRTPPDGAPRGGCVPATGHGIGTALRLSARRPPSPFANRMLPICAPIKASGAAMRRENADAWLFEKLDLNRP